MLLLFFFWKVRKNIYLYCTSLLKKLCGFGKFLELILITKYGCFAEALCKYEKKVAIKKIYYCNIYDEGGRRELLELSNLWNKYGNKNSDFLMN